MSLPIKALMGVGVLCIFYGIFIMAMGSGTWFFAVWIVLGIVIMAFAGSLHLGRWREMSAIGKAIVIIVIVAVAGIIIAAQLAISQDFNDKGEPGLDYIIVPEAQVRQNGPSEVLQYRLDAAFDYLAQNGNTICIVSGGQGPNDPTAKANVMADYLIARGVDPNRIIREDRAEDAAQSIKFSMAVFDPATSRVGIVTNNFNVFRCLNIARKAGIANVCGIAANSSLQFLPSNALSETVSMVADIAKGNMDLPLPKK